MGLVVEFFFLFRGFGVFIIFGIEGDIWVNFWGCFEEREGGGR